MWYISDKKLALSDRRHEFRKRVHEYLPDKRRKNILEGCMKALQTDDGQATDYLWMFIDGYLAQRRRENTLNDPLRSPLDEGLRCFVARPILMHFERLKSLSSHRLRYPGEGHISPPYRKIALQAASIEAGAAADTWTEVKEIIENMRGLEDVGYRSDPATIRARTASAIKIEDKRKIFNGCARAFEEGRPENLHMLLSAELESARAAGSLANPALRRIDGSFAQTVTAPLQLLLEKSRDPAETLRQAAAGLSPFYRQALLDCLLRQACASNDGYKTAEISLKAGADVNAGNGNPLFNAISNEDDRLIDLLCRYNADPRFVMFSTNETFAKQHAIMLARVTARQAAKISNAGTQSTAAPLPALTKINLDAKKSS